MVTPRLTRHGGVSFLRLRPTSGNHDVTTQMAVAQRLAGLLGCEFLGDAAAGHAPPAHGYAVPENVLLSMHDFRRTPKFPRSLRVPARGGARAIKAAAMARSLADCARMLHLARQPVERISAK